MISTKVRSMLQCNLVNSIAIVLAIASMLFGNGSRTSASLPLLRGPLQTSPYRTEQTPLERLPETLPRQTESMPNDSIHGNSASKEELAKLMRPTLGFSSEWQAETSNVELFTYEARVQIPTYPVFGPPPPLITSGFSVFDIDAEEMFELPLNLYESSLGLSWMRRINERWTMRCTLGAAYATDGNNTTSDAWQFRGGLFAFNSKSPQWTWIVGALALGRNDIPVVPAVGAIWQPNPRLRFDLTLPKPKVAFLLVDSGPRQQWSYFGAALNGATWAYERSDGVDDQLTYGDWRVVVGWESTPTPLPGMPFSRGRKLLVEFGYVFSRQFEFDSGIPDIKLADTLMLNTSISF